MQAAVTIGGLCLRGIALVGMVDPLLTGKGERLLLGHAAGERVSVLQGAVLGRTGGWSAGLKMLGIGKLHLWNRSARPCVLGQETCKGCR